MPYTIETPYWKETGYVRSEKYRDGSLALSFVTLDGEPYCALSVNLSGYGHVAPQGCVFVKNYSEGVMLAEGMEAAGIGKRIGTVEFGPYNTTATIMQVTLQEGGKQ